MTGKDYRRQRKAFLDVATQRSQPNHRIVGLMLESHLVAGSQTLADKRSLTYGQSVTDACIGWEETQELILSIV